MTMTTVQTITLQPGDRVLDYASWRPRPGELQALGVKAVIRYVAARTNLPGKLVTAAEVAGLHAQGVGVILNHESYATRAASGYAGGRADGLVMASYCEGLSVPHVPVVASDDTNVTPATLPTHLAYQQGFASTASRPSGPYAENSVMQACVDNGIGAILWYAGARSWSDYKPPIVECHVRQDVVGSVAGKYDMNIVLRPFSVWLPHEAADPPTPKPPTPPTTGADMIIDQRRLTTSPIRLDPNMPWHLQLVAPVGAVGVQLAATVVGSSGAGWLDVWGDGDWPGTSPISYPLISFTKGAPSTGSTVAALTAEGGVNLMASQQVDILVDLLAWVL
jgi:hypothetical protein